MCGRIYEEYRCRHMRCQLLYCRRVRRFDRARSASARRNRIDPAESETVLCERGSICSDYGVYGLVFPTNCERCARARGGELPCDEEARCVWELGIENGVIADSWTAEQQPSLRLWRIRRTYLMHRSAIRQTWSGTPYSNSQQVVRVHFRL